MARTEDSAFIKQIKVRAAQERKKIVLPESNDDRVLRAASWSMRDEIADIVLIGNKDEITARAKKLRIDVSDIEVVNPEEDSKFALYKEKLVELRSKKGMTAEKAEKILHEDFLTYGIMMVKMGDADGMVAGACHATADTLRPALQILRTAPGVEMVSGFFVMCVPDCEMGAKGTFVFGDCGLNQDPDSEQLAVIANSSAKSFKALVEAEPVVALLSHSTKGSAKHALVDKVTEGVRIAHEKYPELKLDGELQLDAAIVPEVGESKAPGSEVAGHANVLIFPNLDAGNIGYKLVQRLGKAEAYGPLLQGLARPVNDLSRGCSSHDVEGVIAITAVQAQIQ
ncbi:phosphate acetyltransferase [Lachnospiraceae bacterium KH1T2]|nr:phosphate acetyltransferase [Lachnospiraceae bacterium KH1T2]